MYIRVLNEMIKKKKKVPNHYTQIKKKGFKFRDILYKI